MKSIMLLVLLTAGPLLALSCSEPETYPLFGGFTITDEDGYSLERCSAKGRFHDIKEGLGVVVRDGEGNIIGTSEFNAGKRTLPTHCEFLFFVYGLPKVEFYEVTLDGRGTRVYSFNQLKEENWIVHFIPDDR